MNKRVDVHYSGRVQGVGFRFTAQALARDLGVCGWVANLADGRVELTGEADEKTLAELLKKLDQQFSRYISNQQVNWMPADNQFSNFEIRF